MQVLVDLRKVLEHKRLSLQGTVGNQATRKNLDNVENKISKLTKKINEVETAIALRKSELDQSCIT